MGPVYRKKFIWMRKELISKMKKLAAHYELLINSHARIFNKNRIRHSHSLTTNAISCIFKFGLILVALLSTINLLKIGNIESIHNKYLPFEKKCLLL